MKRRPFRSKWQRDTKLIDRVISGVRPTPDELLEKQRMIELQSIDAFSRGEATVNDFRVMCDMLNVAETFAKTGVGHEVLEVCEYVQSVLELCKAEYEEQGCMTVDEFELNGLRDLYEYHHIQRTSVDWQQYEKTIVRTGNQIRSQHPDVKVL